MRENTSDKTAVILDSRVKSVSVNDKEKQQAVSCETHSVAGAVSQRACVYCGARVVLNPITDAAHLVHGPIGCAAYTWDIRGSLSSGSERYRNSFSTDLRETDIIFGGEKKLSAAIDELMLHEKPKVIFIYSTCVVGVIGDDVKAIAKRAEEKHQIRVIPVHSSGFAGSKKDGYKAACHAILDLMGDEQPTKKRPFTINFLGDFNLAAEGWIVRSYLKELGIDILATITGDANIEDLRNSKEAILNIVQCAGSMTFLAKNMKVKYDIPFTHVRFYGIEDTIDSLRSIIDYFGDQAMKNKFEIWAEKKRISTQLQLDKYRHRIKDKKVAIYVGGGFKAISLIHQFKDLEIEPVLVGTQTGSKEEYETFRELTSKGTVILDDANPTELEHFMKLLKVDILVGGVKERPLAYKLGVGFLDHNHERKHPLCGFEGALLLAQEIDDTVNSPVWQYIEG